jgi:hypothetical protein
MSDRMALKIAIDLMHVPSQVRLWRSEPLPDGVPMLLKIAAGDDEAEGAAVALTGRSRDLVRQAATFFIEQILFAPNTDSYRVLGATPQADAGELRRNVALLMRWLHPDLEPSGERSIFISRVTVAWNDLKTPQRRAAYDAILQRSNRGRSSRFKNRRWGPAWLVIGKQAKAGDRRGGRLSGHQARGLDTMGFFRRALSVLLHRPLVR